MHRSSQLRTQPPLSFSGFAIPGRAFLKPAAQCCSDPPPDHDRCRDTQHLHSNPALGGTWGRFLPSGGPAWGIAPRSYQEDRPPRGRSLESIRTLNTCMGDERGPRLWLHISKAASDLTKQGTQERAPPTIQGPPHLGVEDTGEENGKLSTYTTERKHGEAGRGGCFPEALHRPHKCPPPNPNKVK